MRRNRFVFLIILAVTPIIFYFGPKIKNLIKNRSATKTLEHKFILITDLQKDNSEKIRQLESGIKVGLLPASNADLILTSVTEIEKIITAKKAPTAIFAHVSDKDLLIKLVKSLNSIPIIVLNQVEVPGTAGKSVFYIAPSAETLGKVLANFTTTKLRQKKICVLQNTDDKLSTSFVKAFVDSSLSSRGKVLSNVSFRGLTMGFGPQFKMIQNFKAEVILMPGTAEEVVEAAWAAQQLGLKLPFLGDFRLAGNYLSEKSKNAAAFYFPDIYSPFDKTDANQEFEKNYVDLFKTKPTSDSALGYEATKIVLSALEKSTANQSLSQILAGSTLVTGLAGKLTFDANKRLKRDILIMHQDFDAKIKVAEHYTFEGIAQIP